MASARFFNEYCQKLNGLCCYSHHADNLSQIAIHSLLFSVPLWQVDLLE